MNLANLLKQLQEKPYKIRLRLLWTTTAVLALILVVIWVFSVRKTVSNIDNENLLAINQSKIIAQEAKYVKVARVEESDASLKIFFSVNNPENDILNFSSSAEIELTYGKTTANPVRIQDRQNKLFVQKILSKTENFGILIFPKTDSNLGKLVFKNLYFETKPDQIFAESLSLNFTQLKTEQELRK